MSFTVTALGTGDAFSADRWSSCLLVETATTRVLVDCPHPIRRVLKSSTGGRVDVGDIDFVILTHLHADHASGVEGFAWFSRFVLQRPMKVVASSAVLAGLWPMLAPSMAELLITDADNHPHHRERLDADDLLQPTTLPLDGPLTLGDLVIEARPTIHHIPTTALRLRHDGASFGYSADTAFDEDLLAWLDAADVAFHETNYGAHTPYARLAALPAPLRDKLRLIHWPDGFDVDSSAIRVLQDGDVVDVGEVSGAGRGTGS
jgi:ribonuclease BN (tRNA processing enzyme)